MSLTGHIIGGQIVLDGSLALPDGAAVRVDVVVATPPVSPPDDADESQPTLREQLKNFLSHPPLDLPPDAAENHDKYFYIGDEQ
jgi:hypothetical protein